MQVQTKTHTQISVDKYDVQVRNNVDKTLPEVTIHRAKK